MCDWVACLRPPLPPPITNLRITGWFGAPVPFNGTATYVCARGTRFLADPYMQNVTYTCQVGFRFFQKLIELVILYINLNGVLGILRSKGLKLVRSKDDDG